MYIDVQVSQLSGF